MNFEATIEFLQELELIKKFNQQTDSQDTYSTTKLVIKCKYCGKEDEKNKSKCPVLGRIFSNCKNKNHFQVEYNYKRIGRVEVADPSAENAEVYPMNAPTKTGEKIKLNIISFHVQVDTGSDVSFMPTKFLEK